jgi:hypothetical protein
MKLYPLHYITFLLIVNLQSCNVILDCQNILQTCPKSLKTSLKFCDVLRVGFNYCSVRHLIESPWTNITSDLHL